MFQIIDGSHLLHRVLGIPDVKTLCVGTQVTGGIFSFLRSLHRIVKQFDCFPIVVFDKGLSQRRLKLYEDYKKNKTTAEAHREAVKPDWLVAKEEHLELYRNQRSYIIDALNYLKIPVVMVDGWEGDDLIYHLVKTYECGLVISEDEDMLQMLNYADLYMPIKSRYYLIKKDGEAKLNIPWNVDYHSLEEDFGMSSVKHFLIYKALLGDTSDNIPGVPGVGKVNAKKISAKMFENKDFLSGLISGEIKPANAYEQKLKDNVDKYEQAYKLIDLSCFEYPKEIVEGVRNTITFSLREDGDLGAYMGYCNRFQLTGLGGAASEFITRLKGYKQKIQI